MDKAITGITSGLKELSPDVNPYEWFLLRLQQQIAVISNLSPAFIRTLYSCFAVGGIGLLASSTVIALKIYSKKFWLLSTRQTSFGTVLVPNTVCLLAIFSSFYFIFSIFCSYFYLQSAHSQGQSNLLWAFQGLLWVNIPLITWTETVGCATSALLCYSFRTSATPEPNYQPRKDRIMPILCKILNIMVVFGFIAIAEFIIAVFSFFTRYFQDSQGAFERLRLALEPAAQAWQPGEKFTLGAKEISLVLAYSSPLLKAANWAPVALLGYAGILAVQLGLFFLPSAIIYIHMLRQQINNASDLHGSVLQPPGQYVIRKSYVLLIIETVGILSLDAAYMAVGFWIGLNPVEVMLTQGPQIAVALTLGILLFSIIITPICILLAYRTLITALNQRRHTQRLSQLASLNLFSTEASGTKSTSRQKANPQRSTPTIDIELDQSSMITAHLTFDVHYASSPASEETKKDEIGLAQ